MTHAFEAFVTAALFDASGQAWFALGDGTVRREDGLTIDTHRGAVLCAAVHPTGVGVLTGGDDGVLAWSREPGAEVLDPRGRRLAVATYGGAWLWYARIAEQKPEILKWAGSHIALAWSPDGKFLMSAMQENQLHGWRVADDKNLKMGGYPAKVKSLAFLSRGQMLATSGANGVVVWPFTGPAGPLGKQAAEVGYDETALVARVAGDPGSKRVAAGLEDGRVWICDLTGQRIDMLKAEKGESISTLAFSRDARRLAWGDEAGGAGVFDLPA